MSIVPKIAFRYFFSRKKRTVVNLVGLISIIATTLLVLSIVVIFSGFNGLDGLVKQIFRTFDPEIVVLPREGKKFTFSSEIKNTIQSVEGVDIMSEVIEDDAVLKYGDQSAVVKFKGVDANYFRQNDFSTSITKGQIKLLQDSSYYALIGQGVEYNLAVPLNSQFTPMVLWYVRNTKNPKKAPFPAAVKASGVFAIEKQFDDHYIFIPLEMAAYLTEYTNERTAIELNIKQGYAIDEVKENLKAVLGETFKVLNSDEQHAGLYKAHKIEKLITFIILFFVLLIGSLTIFFTLSMQVMEKQKDISVMLSYGTTREQVRMIFLANGLIISAVGVILGLVLGFLIIYAQQTYGLVSMGMETSIVQAYPVEIRPFDFLITALSVIIVSVAMSIYPAIKASQVKITDNL